MLIILLFLVGSSLVRGEQVTVAADGTGDVRTVQEAINSVPVDNRRRFVIFIKAGTYNEQIRVPANKPYISFVGKEASKIILTFKISNREAGTTSAAYAAYIGGHDFFAENITFENSFGRGSQAVAVLAEADRVVFRNCRFLGWQDTLYAKNGRQYYENCYIEGHVDFIFGEAAAVFDRCTIHGKADGYITAPMRFSADEPTGFVFLNSTITSENTKNGIFLGRPWRDYGRTVFLNTKMNAAIRPEGWNHWLPEREKTAYFAEYNSSGSGANVDARVKWAHQLSGPEIKAFFPKAFLRGQDGWNPKSAKDEWLEKHSPDWKLIAWSEALRQKPQWYQTDEAARIADQIVLYQKENGGWEKNIDMAAMLTEKEKAELKTKRFEISETTIDNRTSYTQVAFLGKIISASLQKSTPPNDFPKYKDAFNRGVDYLLAAQYESGGYPQFYPLKKGYYTHITFNDDATIGVLRVLRDIARKESDYEFVDEQRRAKAESAVTKAIPLILKLQVVINGRRTVWAQQYDEKTFAPTWARKFEPPSLTAGESVGVVRFLMGEKPTREIKDAIEAAVEWYRNNQLTGIRWQRKNGENSVINDTTAPPIWARFYEISTMKPIFVGRDSVIHYDESEIEAERRNGYAWYISEPNQLLNMDYPKWKAKVAVH